MTGDADLVYCVEVAKSFSKPIHMIALGSRFPYAISFMAEKRIVFDFGGFFTKRVLPGFKYKPTKLTIREIQGEVEVISIQKPDAERPGKYLKGTSIRQLCQ